MNTSKKSSKNGSREKEKVRNLGIPAWVRVVDVGDDWRYPRIAERSEGISKSKKPKRLYVGDSPE